MLVSESSSDAPSFFNICREVRLASAIFVHLKSSRVREYSLQTLFFKCLIKEMPYIGEPWRPRLTTTPQQHTILELDGWVEVFTGSCRISFPQYLRVVYSKTNFYLNNALHHVANKITSTTLFCLNIISQHWLWQLLTTNNIDDFSQAVNILPIAHYFKSYT